MSEKTAATFFEVSIPVDWLLALRFLAANKDQREWINSVSIINSYLLATDGICMGAIPCEQFEGLPSMTIPRATLDEVLALPRGTAEKNIAVRWTRIDGGEMYGSLSLGRRGVAFIPDQPYAPKSIISYLCTHHEPNGHPQLDWSRIGKFARAALALGASETDPYKVHLVPSGDEAPVRVKLPSFLDFEGVIMPIAASLCLAAENFVDSKKEEVSV